MSHELRTPLNAIIGLTEMMVKNAARFLPLASRHSITSSARASRVGGTVRPTALAVFIFTISSNLIGSSTGKSATLSPLMGLAPKASRSAPSCSGCSFWW